MKNTTFVGNIGEQIAADYLKEHGYKILDRNIKICDCEVDIIAEAYVSLDGRIVKNKSQNVMFKRLFNRFKPSISDKNKSSKAERTVIFCEVKTRMTDSFGSGAEAVTPYKAGRYVTAAKAYMAGRFDANTAVRFDVIEISGEEIYHIENAFDENYAKYGRK